MGACFGANNSQTQINLKYMILRLKPKFLFRNGKKGKCLKAVNNTFKGDPETERCKRQCNRRNNHLTNNLP